MPSTVFLILSTSDLGTSSNGGVVGTGPDGEHREALAVETYRLDNVLVELCRTGVLEQLARLGRKQVLAVQPAMNTRTICHRCGECDLTDIYI